MRSIFVTAINSAPDPQTKAPAGLAKGSDRRLLVAFAATIAITMAARDALLLSVFRFHWTADTASYFTGSAARTRPYPILSMLTNASANPLPLVWLQILLAAF